MRCFGFTELYISLFMLLFFFFLTETYTLVQSMTLPDRSVLLCRPPPLLHLLYGQLKFELCKYLVSISVHLCKVTSCYSHFLEGTKMQLSQVRACAKICQASHLERVDMRCSAELSYFSEMLNTSDLTFVLKERILTIPFF